ncbi:vomeronasal type-2 receptor 26-like [Anomaloglossus baeobatrachus]
MTSLFGRKRSYCLQCHGIPLLLEDGPRVIEVLGYRVMSLYMVTRDGVRTWLTQASDGTLESLEGLLAVVWGSGQFCNFQAKLTRDVLCSDPTDEERIPLWFLLFSLICKSGAQEDPRCGLLIYEHLFEYEYYKDGDVFIGGIFTAHSMKIQVGHHELEPSMVILVSIREYQQLMAFIFTIDQINRSPDLLPNITLGYHVFDSCGNINKVIRDVLHIMTGIKSKFAIPNYSFNIHGVLAGYIGDLHPYTTNPMAELLSIFGYTQTPVGLCSLACPPGSRQSPKEHYHSCCHDCIPCPEGHISNISDSENCLKCPDGKWPNEDKDECLPKIIEYLSYEKDVMAAVFSSTSGLFLIITIHVSGIFIFFSDTPIVKANNRNISFILLLSLKLSLLCVFLFIGRPDDTTCMLRQISIGVTFTIAVSSILAKSIMVSIAFKVTRPGSSWRRWMGPILPNSVVLICSFIQFLDGIIWVSVSPPFQELDVDSYPGKIILQCNEGSVGAFYFMLGYLGFLAAVSFVLAFMVRTLPDIYNEAKYITFSMLLFCSVWICAIPAYLSSKGKNMVMVEIFSILASEIGILGCIFFPKCYNIIMRPEMKSRRQLLEKH